MKIISKTDKIFIAGHKGMVGSAIKRSLERKGYNNLITINRDVLDLADSENVKKWFAKNKPDIVILAAAKVGGIEANSKYPADFILENLKIQTNIIESSWNFKSKRLLFLGSSCIYPKFAEQPINEESLLTSSLEPTNEPYAIAKIAGLKLCEYLRKQYNFNAISLMPSNLYGPGDNYHLTNSHVLPALINRFHNAKLKNQSHVVCWGTGEPKREFLHVDDLAEAAIYILENYSKYLVITKTLNTSFLNVGTGKDIRIKDLALLIADKFKFKGEIIWDSTKPDGTPRKLLNVSKINEIGWFAKISLEEGIEETIKNFLHEKRANNIRL